MTAGGIDAAHLTNLIDASLGTAPFIPTVPPLSCRLLAMIPSGSAAHDGVEYPPGGGYATGGQPISFSAANYNALVIGAGAAGNNPVSWPNMPAGTPMGMETWDAAGRRKWWTELIDPEPLMEGDTFSFPASSVIPQIIG
jgi:hypothetical protein